MESFTDEELNKIYRKAMVIAKKYGHERNAEDIAQECLIQIIQGRKTQLNNIVIDVLRAESGRKKRPDGTEWASYKIRRQLYSGLKEYDDRLFKNTTQQNVISKLANAEYLGLLKDYLRKKNKFKELFILDKYLDGHLLKEIGDCMGVTESRISQLLNGIIYKARKLNQTLGMKSHRTQQKQNNKAKVETLILLGYTNEMIAKKLNLEEQTIKNYLTEIFLKYNVPNRHQLIVKLFKARSEKLELKRAKKALIQMKKEKLD